MYLGFLSGFSEILEMGAETNSNSASECDVNNNNSETQVMLNVYDLTPMNNYTSFFGFGIFHSGIEG